MKVVKKQFNRLISEQKQQVVKFIEDHYNAPEFLKPSLEELEFINLTIFLALEPIDLFEAGCVGYDILGVGFFEKITKTLAKTRTTVIKESHRGTGIGSQINKSMEGHFKKIGINKIYCNIYTDNLP